MSDSIKIKQLNLPPPIVINRKNKKKQRKRKYSSGLKDIQLLERDITKITHQVVRSLDDGLAVYQKARDKAAKKKRDGAIIEFVPNMGKGISKTMRTASSIPYTLAKASSKTAQRLTRYQLRIVTQIADDVLSQ